MGELLLSVIVPVYRAENFIERCVGSILAQTVSDLELILVDDGSPDRSGELCDRLAAGDGRVRVLHRENAGASAARNAGIEATRGRYIQFVDADDWLAPDYSAELLAAAERTGAELVIAGYRTSQGGVQTSHIPPDASVCSVRELAEQFDGFYFAMMINSPCNKLYLREKLDARFPSGVPMGEDLMFNMTYLEQAERLAVISADGYIYEQEPEGGSARARFVGDEPTIMLDYCRCVLPFLKQWSGENVWRRTYDRIVFHSLCNNLNTLARTGRDSRSAFRSYLDNREVRDSIRRVDLLGFPRAKRIAGWCLKRGLYETARLGIRMAAQR